MSRKGENIYKRKDGRWEGRIRNDDGKYHSLYAKTYKEVREKMHVAKLKPVVNSTKAACTCKNKAVDLFEEWLAGELKARVKPTTYQSYFQCMEKYILPFFRKRGNEYINAVSASGFAENIWKNTDISEASRRKVISIFKVAIRAVTPNEPQYAYILENIKMPQIQSGKYMPVFTVKEQRGIEYAVKKSKDKRALGIIICLYTGIRIGELCALNDSDFDWETGIMTISRTVSRIRNFEDDKKKTRLHVGTPKSSTSLRKIPLPAFLMEMLRKNQINSGKENCNIISGKPEPFDPRTYQRIYKSMLKQAGIKYRKFHALRHSFATRALELGVDIKTISEILGHANVSITLNIYTHSLMEQKKAAIEKFNHMYMSCTKPEVSAVISMVERPVSLQ